MSPDDRCLDSRGWCSARPKLSRILKTVLKTMINVMYRMECSKNKLKILVIFTQKDNEIFFCIIIICWRNTGKSLARWDDDIVQVCGNGKKWTQKAQDRNREKTG